MANGIKQPMIPIIDFAIGFLAKYHWYMWNQTNATAERDSNTRISGTTILLMTRPLLAKAPIR